MLTINNLHKIIGETIVIPRVEENEHWTVNDIDTFQGVYDINLLRKLGIFDTIKRTIRIHREKNSLGMYSVQIIQSGKIIDKDQLRLRNIQTAEGMLSELKTVMQFI